MVMFVGVTSLVLEAEQSVMMSTRVITVGTMHLSPARHHTQFLLENVNLGGGRNVPTPVNKSTCTLHQLFHPCSPLLQICGYKLTSHLLLFQGSSMWFCIVFFLSFHPCVHLARLLRDNNCDFNCKDWGCLDRQLNCGCESSFQRLQKRREEGNIQSIMSSVLLDIA